MQCMPVRSLSGGYKRRLALAIQLVRDPYVLCLDEPLAGLDWMARAEVTKLLANLRRERAVVVVSHDVEEIAPVADRAWRMGPGGVMRPEPELAQGAARAAGGGVRARDAGSGDFAERAEERGERDADGEDEDDHEGGVARPPGAQAARHGGGEGAVLWRLASLAIFLFSFQNTVDFDLPSVFLGRASEPTCKHPRPLG